MNKLAYFLTQLLICLLFFIGFISLSNAQVGYSSASFSSNRSNGIVSSEQVIVEEYINYHRHRIPLPNNGESVAIDMRWGNEIISDNDPYAVLQIGFATEIIDDFSNIEPVNICLVIDKSGSMASDSRMLKLKIALNRFVDNLRPNDKIAIVAYDSEADLLLPMQFVADKLKVKLVISSLKTGGNTNLNDGMMTGYKELEKYYCKNSTNRLVLLTDGLTNTGVTDTEKIIKNSLEYNKKGIDISTIGVGYNVNFDLLRQLAKAGRGLNHFVGQSEDIEKVFINEVESLLSPVAKDVSIEVNYDDNIDISHIYGYSPKFSDHKISFELDNMNSGLTQIILLNFSVKELKKSGSANAELLFKYFDIKLKREVEIRKTISLVYSKNINTNFLKNKEVKRNYTIAIIAQALKDMAVAYELNKKGEAKQIINDCISTVKDYYPYLKDKDILRILEIAERYETLLNS